MERICLNVSSEFCGDCSLAIKRFISSIKGVKSVDIERRKVIIEFDSKGITENEIAGIAKGSIERLGYKIE